ncbi:helix-turn-helix transcriptional regulator [Tistrella mobilis]|uniref:helix-turn-helix transcriptional regulator n=1 Tax=Tistrella mobilis TaxID=171437 RepID=UPI003557529E
MTRDEFKITRDQLGLTQADLGARMGVSRNAIIDLEAGKTTLRPMHALAIERVSLAVAIERRDPMLAAPSVRREALALVQLITG